MDEKPARAGATGLAFDDLAVEANGKLEAAASSARPSGLANQFDDSRVGVGSRCRVIFVMDVELDIVRGGCHHPPHRLTTATLLVIGARQEADKIIRIRPDKPLAAAQGVVQMRLVKKREAAGEVDALGRTTKVVYGLHHGGTDRGSIADRPPRFEMVGVEISDARNIDPAQAIRQLLHQGRISAHSLPVPSVGRIAPYFFSSVTRNLVSMRRACTRASIWDTTQSSPCRSMYMGSPTRTGKELSAP